MNTQMNQSYNRGIQENTGLYENQYEHDACGVGMIADLNNVASHKIIVDGITILKRLMHRGANGSDPHTGDGAGLLCAMPDMYFRNFFSTVLPPKGEYGVAMIFGGEGSELAIEQLVAECGAKVLFWRSVPVQIDALGENARKTCPVIRQLFIDGSNFTSQNAFELKLYLLRRLIEKKIADTYVCSCSSKTIVYKGLLMATQIDGFYEDLRDERFVSPYAIVHQRYSTNTFPTWQLAQPFRFLAHNGEINTLKGNLNHLKTREPHLSSHLLKDDLAEILPLVPANQSDSACLDNMLELLVASGRDIRHAMLMLMPQAWGAKHRMSNDVRGFFEYHSVLMEPWDGPTALTFCDGVNVGAILDRNGLRPARYTLTTDNLFVLASETGVLDIPSEKIAKLGRLSPGKMIFCDLENHRLQTDNEIKTHVARRKPYRQWVKDNSIDVHGMFSALQSSQPMPDLLRQQAIFGYTQEDLDLIISPMYQTGHEAVGSMGYDAPLAILSHQNPLLFDYFKQLFAQVTNPPIDPIRESLVMSLTTYIGNDPNILEEYPQHAHVIKLVRPILTDDELSRLKHVKETGFASVTLPILFNKTQAHYSLKDTLHRLACSAVEAVRDGARILVLSDRNPGEDDLPIPSLLACCAVNKALTDANLRANASIILETGEARETMHFALLLGYGATAINPYLALASISELSHRETSKIHPVNAASNYIKAVSEGLYKIMSKMGISTLRSYRSSQLFEAIGLSEGLVQEYFSGTTSRIGGIDIEWIERETRQRVEAALAYKKKDELALAPGGFFKPKKEGESHMWIPGALQSIRTAVRENDQSAYDKFSKLMNQQQLQHFTLRSLLDVKLGTPIPLEEVESVESILQRFVAGAMSLGSISPEAHESIAIAMNMIGARSNSGEGGEDENRYHPSPEGFVRSSAIKQVASGRFGVTIDYLHHAKEIQIKMAQGAKPGEGGQLPGDKVNDFIAKLRHANPGTSLISPAPHHDIYSIEDLAQLIFDLQNANTKAKISVKLVSEAGVGTIAAGVVKAHADSILISGYDGGTGAAPLSSVKYAGLPWELGVAEVHQTLALNDLRSRVKLQVDGQIRTGRDIVVATLLGADEFGFGSIILIALGCAMLRRCHENTCPVGIATQDPELRKKYSGKPEFIVNYLRFVAQEARLLLAELGLHSLDEARGRTDFLTKVQVPSREKASTINLDRLLQPVTLRPDMMLDEQEPFKTYDSECLLQDVQEVLQTGGKVTLQRHISNNNRTIGTELSSKIAELYGERGMAEDSITVDFYGHAGQSFGAFLTNGMTFKLHGEANDFVGKGLCGGKIILVPSDKRHFEASQNMIAGNVVGYGATSGTLYINGQAGDRFAIRNSGATLIVEGLGDHGCEYMTNGRVVVLGKTGVNFAAGMTGGKAYILDEDGTFDTICNLNSVNLSPIDRGSDEERELLELVNAHYRQTQSICAKNLLDSWAEVLPLFVVVRPI